MKQKLRLSGLIGFLTPTLAIAQLTWVVGCRPDLPVPSSEPLATSSATEFVVRIEPDAPLDATPRAIRAYVQGSNPIDKERVFFIRGEVTDYHLRQIERADLTKTLQERIVPTVVWAQDERNVVVAPTVLLEIGQTYALASGEPAQVVHIVVGKDHVMPLLARRWPPKDTASHFGIFCNSVEIAEIEREVTLDPLGPVGMLRRGIAANGPGRGCVRFDILDQGEKPSAGPWVLPSILEIPGVDGSVWRVEPGTFEVSGVVAEEPVAVECAPEEVSFGPGCAAVMDDRIGVRAPGRELFWGISGQGMEIIKQTSAQGRFVLTGLAPETEVTFNITTVDRFGRTQQEGFTGKTATLSAHLVLNEVMANPVGPEPHQEWIELYNDGQVGTSLAGYKILDIGGETVLPDVLLLPGQFALVVNETFVADDEVDVPPPPGTMLVYVPRLGKSGLSNSGELLRLVDPEGHTISRFPALPKPKVGQSVSRRTATAPDGVSSSFAITEPTPGIENFVNADP